MFKMKRKKGFTIIELIVVMAIIGVLVLLAMPKFMGYTEKAKLTQIKSDIKQVENASERYYIDKNDWPRLTDVPYTAAQITTFAQEITDKTGQVVTLDATGNYYDIDYSKLQTYIQKPKNNTHYIIQNPVGEVYYLRNLTILGENRLIPNNKPTAVITMTPMTALTTATNITWNYVNSTDPDSDTITNAEWQGKQDIYTTTGTYTVKLRVQDSNELWSDWVAITFIVLRADSVNQLLVGGFNSSVILNDGTFKGWGCNSNGELGDGTTNNRLTPTIIPGLINAIIIVKGYEHTLAVMNNGTVKAWGMNDFGQLGNGDTLDKSTPITIAGLTNVKTIATGTYHSLAIMNDGTVKSWGYNMVGQLGDGTTINKTTPITIPGLTNVKSITAGFFHTVALLDDGTVKAWGTNSDGELGDGTTIGRLTPIIVSGLTNVKNISAGTYHTLALMNDGTVKAWGWNYYGELGDGTTINKTIPITIPGLTNVKTITAGYGHTVALMNDGTVKAWGDNAQGQLGDGTTTNKGTPTTVLGLTNVKSITAGEYNTVALLNDGTVKAWGSNDYGQLGDGTTTNRLTPTIVLGLN